MAGDGRSAVTGIETVFERFEIVWPPGIADVR
jgi:hypothetical protein